MSGCAPLFAVLIAQQTALFRTDLRSTHTPEQTARHAIGPGAPCQQGRFSQWLADRSSLQLAEQASGWTPATPTPLAAKTSSRYLHASEGRGDYAAHGSLQAARLLPTLMPTLIVLFP